MSIASALQTLTNTIRGIATTKGQIKSAVNTDFDVINNEQIELYPNKIRTAIERYKSYIPTVHDEDKQLIMNTIPLPSKEFAMIGDAEQKTRILPEGYSQLEYIESDGSQYVDTGIYLNSDDLKIKTKIYTASMPSSEQDILGNQDSATNRFVFGLYGGYVFGYSRSTEVSDPNIASSVYSGANTLEIEMNYDYSHNIRELTVNSSTETRVQNARISNNNNTIKIFDNGSVSANRFAGKLFFMQLYIDGELAHDYIPCKNSNNEAGLYDLVGKVFLGNSGTGTFTAGAESVIPNPSYPQEVQVVKGEQKYVKRSRNILNIQNTVTHAGITSTKNADGSVKIEGTMTETYFRITDSDNLASISITEGQYVFSIDEAITDFALRLRLYEKGSQNYTNLDISAGQTSTSFTSEKEYDRYYIYAFGGSVGTVLNKTVKFQIKEGSTATTYEPYYRKELTVYLNSVNKNMLNPEYAKVGSINSSTGEYVENSNNLMGENYIKVEPNTTYCLSGNTTFNSLRASEYDLNKTHIQRNEIYGAELVVTTSANTHYLRWSFNFNGQATSKELVNTLELQLEKNNSRTSYVEFKALELAKINDNADVIFRNKKTSKYYNAELEEDAIYFLEKKGKHTFNGTESGWGTSGTNVTGANRFANSIIADLIKKPANVNTVADILANEFIAKTAGNTYTCIAGISVNASGTLYIYSDETKTMTVNDFKTWLSTHNLILYYLLETPTYTKITDSTFISQWEAIENETMLDGVTIIETEQEEGLAPTLYIEAYTHIEEE